MPSVALARRLLWTSIATGKLPDKHGVLGFLEPSIDGRTAVPVGSATRRTEALWNILRNRATAVTQRQKFLFRAPGHRPWRCALPPNRLDTAAVLGSELASNVVRHAGTPYVVELHTGELIRIEVTDWALGVPVVRAVALDAVSGRGLQIVSRLSTDWGVEWLDGCKVVWAEGDLRAVRGAGRYVKRPPFGTQFEAVARRSAALAPSAVQRPGA